MSNKPLQVAFLINSYNRLSLFQSAIAALDWLRSSHLANSTTIVIFDAGSTDGTREWIETEIDRFPVRTIFVDGLLYSDTSFSAGLNTCAEVAMSAIKDLDYFVFYETDNQIRSEESLLRAINELERRSELAACGFTVVKQSGSRAGLGMPFPRPTAFILGNQLVSKLSLEAINYTWEYGPDGTLFSLVDVVYTSPLVVNVEAWRDSGAMNHIDFPFSDCDVDWARRLRDLNWRMGVVKTEDVIHDNLEQISEWSRKRAINMHRARIKYFELHSSGGAMWLRPFLLIRHLVERLACGVFVREKTRRKNLQTQFDELIRACLGGYK